MIIDIIAYAAIATAIIGSFLLIRNQWVFRKRVGMIGANFQRYLNWPSYEYMLFHFWIWNVDKFDGKGK